MWTQFSVAEFSMISGSASSIALATTLDSSVSVGDWIVLSPLKDTCEIRKIIAINTSTDIDLNAALVQSHTPGDIIYISTSPNWDILLFGAISNDIASASANTTAFKNAIADILQNISGSFFGGIISIPVGAYFLDIDSSSGNCINLSGVNNIQFIGEGNGNNDKVSRLIPVHGNCNIFYLYKTKNISIENITLDGSALDNGNCGIDIFGQGTSIEANLTFNKIQFLLFGNCGLRTIYTRKQIINQCYLFECNQGLNILDESWNVWVEDCSFRKNINEDILIDSSSEDSSSAYIASCLIKNNVFDREETLSSNITALKILSTTNNSLLNYRFIITGNEFHDCNIYIEFCRELIFSNNIIIGATSGIPFEAKNTIEEFCFEKNHIKTNSASENAIMLHSTDYDSTIHFCPKNVIVSGNNFEQGQCYFENVNNLTFQNNNVRNSSGEPLYAGFYLKLTNHPDLFSLTDYGNLSIANNQIWGDFSIGVYLNSYDTNYKLNLINIESNAITNTHRYGVYIDRIETTILQYWSKLLISKSNTIINPTIEIDVFTFYLIEINPFQECWITKGVPGNIDNQIYAPQGSLAIDNTLEADNNYSKNSYKDYIDGWELISEMGKQTLFRTFFSSGSGSLTTDVPSINVFPVSTTVWTDYFGVWNINGNSEAYANLLSGGSTGIGIALFEGDSNFELKTCMRIDTTPGNTFNGGIIFRCNVYGDYLVYYISYVSGVPTLNCDKVISAVITPFFSSPISINSLERVVLKILMKNEMLSFFYNELLVENIVCNDNLSAKNHGIYCDTLSNVFFQNFKQLIP